MILLNSLFLVFVSTAEVSDHCRGPEVQNWVMPDSLEAAMTVVGRGVPFIEGTDLVSSFASPKVASNIRGSCQSALEKAKDKGELFSEVLFENSIPIKNYIFTAGSEPTRFYHYTDSLSFLNLFHVPRNHLFGYLTSGEADRDKAHREMVWSGEYLDFFEGLRADQYKSWWKSFSNKVLYVAADPTSSKGFGHHRVSFWLEPKARVLKRDFARGKFGTELYEKHLEIWRHCSLDDSILAFAEGTGIALHDYWGGGQWFTLLSPGFITKTLPEANVHSGTVDDQGVGVRGAYSEGEGGSYGEVSE